MKAKVASPNRFRITYVWLAVSIRWKAVSRANRALTMPAPARAGTMGEKMEEMKSVTMSKIFFFSFGASAGAEDTLSPLGVISLTTSS